MTPEEKAEELVNEIFYQPLTLHLNLSNNSRQMWDYAKLCALACVDEVLNGEITAYPNQKIERGQVFIKFWNEVKTSITNL